MAAVPRYKTYWVLWWILRLLFPILFRWKIEGLENVPKDRPLIIAPNHISHTDPFFVGEAISIRTKKPVWFMAKPEWLEVPILSWFIKRMHVYPVKRGKVDKQSIEKTLSLLKAGETVLIFPEGTRSLDGRLQDLKQGVAMLAKRSGALIIPVGITGSNKVLTPRSSRFRFFRKVTIRIGAPLSVPESAPKAERETFLPKLHQAIAELLPDENKPTAGRAAVPS